MFGGRFQKVSDKYIVKIKIPRKINKQVVPNEIENGVFNIYNLEIRCNLYYLMFYGRIFRLIFCFFSHY